MFDDDLESYKSGFRDGIAKERTRWEELLFKTRKRHLPDLHPRAHDLGKDVPCTCGSGGHPRWCDRHPMGWDLHRYEIMYEQAYDEIDDLVESLESALSGESAALEEAASFRDERDVLGDALNEYIDKLKEVEDELDEMRAQWSARVEQLRKRANEMHNNPSYRRALAIITDENIPSKLVPKGKK